MNVIHLFKYFSHGFKGIITKLYLKGTFKEIQFHLRSGNLYVACEKGTKCSFNRPDGIVPHEIIHLSAHCRLNLLKQSELLFFHHHSTPKSSKIVVNCRIRLQREENHIYYHLTFLNNSWKISWEKRPFNHTVNWCSNMSRKSGGGQWLERKGRGNNIHADQITRSRSFMLLWCGASKRSFWMGLEKWIESEMDRKNSENTFSCE